MPLRYFRYFFLPALIILSLSPAEAQTPSVSATPTGDTLFIAGQFEPARQAFIDAAKASPEDIAPHLSLIRTLLRQDNWPDAVSEAQATTAKFPSSADAHGLLSLALIRAGWLEGYAGEAARSLALDPKDYWGLVATGRAQEWDGKILLARAPFRQAAAAHPEWPEAWMGLTETLSTKLEPMEKAGAVAAYLKLSPHGQPHDRLRERLSEATRSAEAIRQGFGTGTLFEHTLPLGKSGAAATETIPITFAGAYVLLPVKINGIPLHLIWDTGAGGKITLNSSAARSLKLPPLVHSFTRGVSGREDSDVLKAESLTLGERTYHTVLIGTISDLPGSADGLFGGNILRDTVVTVDFAASTMQLASGEPAAAPPVLPGDKSVTLPFHVSGGHLYTPVSVQTKRLWALLDTGASVTHLSLREAKDLLQKVPKAQLRSGTVKSRMGIGKTNQLVDYLAARSTLDLTLSQFPPTSFPMAALGLSELDREVSPGVDFEIGLLLGMSSLTHARRFTLDYPHRQLIFEYSATTRPPGKLEKP